VKSLRVLAVDDEPALGKVVSRLLAVDGHTVATARSVEEAIAELANDRFDVVLSDLGLGPGAESGGWDLAAHVAAHYPGTRFLLATGWDHRSIRRWRWLGACTASFRNRTS
jgi:DNA-binding NtrC family response regulator